MADALPPGQVEILVELRDALTSLVETDRGFGDLVLIALNKELETITEEGLLPDRVWAVIRWAYDRNRLIILVDRALTEYDRPARLQDWSDANRWKFLRASSEEQTKTSTPDITPHG